MKIEFVKGLVDSNTYIIECNDEVILVDAGAPLEDVVKALNGRVVTAIFLTHEHFDHTYYIAKYCEAFNPLVYCHSSTIAELKTNKINRIFCMMFGKGMGVSAPKSFDRFNEIADNQVLKLNNFIVKAVHAPGHSEGSVVYLINNNLFSGDVLFRTSVGRTDLMKNGKNLMQQTLRKLQTLKFDKCYNGHSGESSYENQQSNIKSHLV